MNDLYKPISYKAHSKGKISSFMAIRKYDNVIT